MSLEDAQRWAPGELKQNANGEHNIYELASKRQYYQDKADTYDYQIIHPQRHLEKLQEKRAYNKHCTVDDAWTRSDLFVPFPITHLANQGDIVANYFCDNVVPNLDTSPSVAHWTYNRMVEYVEADGKDTGNNLFAWLETPANLYDDKQKLKPVRTDTWVFEGEENRMGFEETLSPGPLFSLAYARVHDKISNPTDRQYVNQNWINQTIGGTCRCANSQTTYNVGVITDATKGNDASLYDSTELACYGTTDERSAVGTITDPAHQNQAGVTCHDDSIIVPIVEYKFHGKLRAQIDVEISTLNQIEDRGTKRDCANEASEYLTHTKRREEYDYDCSQHSTYDTTNLAAAVEIKKIYDMPKMFKLRYKFFHFDETDVGKDAETEYVCKRVHLNLFILDQDTDDPYAEGGSATLAKFPFLCHAKTCPTFQDIECGEKCVDKQVCIKNMYKGKVTSEYIFSMDGDTLEQTEQWIEDRIQSSLTNHNYSGVNHQTLNADGSVNMTCWPNWNFSNDGVIDDVDSTHYMNGMKFKDPSITCDVDRSVTESKPKAKFCEVYNDTTDNCELCYQGYTLYNNGYCYGIDSNDPYYEIPKPCPSGELYCNENDDLAQDHTGIAQCEFSWHTNECHICADGYIVSHDKLSCVENTICGFTDTDKQAYCRAINDPVTDVHMNGCRILETDYTLRDRVEDATEETWEGEWRCAQCKPGWYQASVANEYCKPMLTNNPSVQQDLTNLTQQNRLNLEECFRRKSDEGNGTGNDVDHLCYKLGLLTADTTNGFLEHKIHRFLGAYQHMVAERNFVLAETASQDWFCRLSGGTTLYKWWNGYSYNCNVFRGPNNELVANDLCGPNAATLTPPFDVTQVSNPTAVFGLQNPEQGANARKLYGFDHDCTGEDWCPTAGATFTLLDTLDRYVNDKSKVGDNAWVKYMSSDFDLDYITNFLQHYICSHDAAVKHYGETHTAAMLAADQVPHPAEIPVDKRAGSTYDVNVVADNHVTGFGTSMYDVAAITGKYDTLLSHTRVYSPETDHIYKTLFREMLHDGEVNFCGTDACIESTINDDTLQVVGDRHDENPEDTS